MSNVKWFIGLLIVVILFWLGKQLYYQPKYVHGEKAPVFEASLIDGTHFSLEDLQGKYVLIDFWGSWCGPCRHENPQLVALWKKYNKTKFKDARGFEIVSIGLETDENRWKRAIANDGLEWDYHIADMNRMKSEIGLLYGVKEIPTKYLINPDGYIMGVNQSALEIAELLEKRRRD